MLSNWSPVFMKVATRWRPMRARMSGGCARYHAVSPSESSGPSSRRGKELGEGPVDVVDEAPRDRGDGLAQLRIASRRHHELEPGMESRAGHHRPEEVDGRPVAVRPLRQVTERRPEFGVPPPEEML